VTARAVHFHRFAERQNTWFVFCVVLATIIVLHAFYYDYSDAYVHSAAAFVSVLAGLVRPKIGAACGAVWLLAAVVGHAMIPDASRFGAQVRPGMSRSEVVNRLGAPEIVIGSPSEMANLRMGYSKPSPWRYRQVGPVEVYVRSEYALWIFYRENGQVAYYFIGGS